ncbi:MAG: PKD domain-containing protein [Thermoplasmatales archaeon]|nr:PKD domain-containing protein [Thermoplasmatales archaeon]
MRSLNRTIPICFAFILFLSIFTIIFPIQICSAQTTIHVYEGKSIQAAINSANESGGDTVYVHGGTYSSTVILIIDRPLILTGAGSGSTTISASGDHTVKVTADNVEISGFKIQNSGSSFYCVFLDTVTGCSISNNNVKDGGNGIYLDSSNSNTIESNTIESNNNGIYMFNSDSNTIKSNTIQNNQVHGIWLTSTASSNNIYLNDFSDNMDSNARDQGSNNWDYNSQGNYWDDYNDYDNDENGIGDNPYSIGGGGGNQDSYPLGDFLSSDEKPVAYIDSISPNPADLGQTIYFSGRGTDSDGSITAWEWKSDGVVIGTSGDFSTSSLSAGSHTISFRVKDNDDNWSPSVQTTLVINSPNQIPTAYILEPMTSVTKQFGEEIRFAGGGADDGEIMEYSWISDRDEIISVSNQFTKSDLTVGRHIIYFKVRDDYGEWSSEVTIIVTITSNPSNSPPVADAGEPYTGYVNQNLTFDGSASSDPDAGDSITSYQWDFGDETTGEGATIGHTYTSEGNYTVELTVTDGNGEQTKIATYVNIELGDSQNGDNGDEDNGIPSFEAVFVIIAIALILFYKKRK